MNSEITIDIRTRSRNTTEHTVVNHKHQSANFRYFKQMLRIAKLWENIQQKVTIFKTAVNYSIPIQLEITKNLLIY